MVQQSRPKASRTTRSMARHGSAGKEVEDDRKRKASPKIADELRQQIVSGQLQPGDSMPPESTLMEMFGVARPTMREALRILESDGYIKVFRGSRGGARVQEIAVTDLARRAGLYLEARGADFTDLLEARKFIEPGAVGLAAKNATREQVAQLFAAANAIADVRSPSEFAEAAANFNIELLRASGNITLEAFALVIDHLTHQEFHRTLDDMQFTTEVVELTHQQFVDVVKLIEQGFSDAARAFWLAVILQRSESSQQWHRSK